MTPAPTPMETTPEQLAAVWGLSSPLAPTVSTPPRQGQSTRPRALMAQQNRFCKGMGRGAGKAAQPHKRTREQDEEEKLEMETDQLDEKTIRGILRLLVRAAAWHEQQLTSLEADSSYISPPTLHFPAKGSSTKALWATTAASLGVQAASRQALRLRGAVPEAATKLMPQPQTGLRPRRLKAFKYFFRGKQFQTRTNIDMRKLPRNAKNVITCTRHQPICSRTRSAI